MRYFAKAVCMMLVLLSLAVTAMASESGVVTQTKPIAFHAERGIFLSAEIVNPGTENQTLKVVLPDSTILYRDLSNNQVWKEQKANGRFLKSSTLTEEELNLLSGLNLDTGWFPPSFPVQLRFFLKVSTGTIVADLPGDVQLSYNDDEVQVGEQLDTWLKWVGDHGGGNLQMEGGIEFGAMWKVYVDLPWPLPDLNDSGYIPKIPNIDFGFFRDCEFTPFLLDNALSCNANISSTRLPIPSIGWEGIAALYVGADVAGEVTGTLAGTSVCGNNAYCIYHEGDEKYFPVQISNCQTNVGVENKYNSSFRLEWEVSLTPTGCLDLFLFPDICFSPYTLDFTIFNQNLPLDFNRPNVQFQIEGQVPPPPTVVAGCGYIDVSWSSVSGATEYCVYRDGSKRTCISGTSWRDSSPGSSQRCYQITAKNGCGESAKSSQRCATAKQVPPPPPPPTVIAGCGYIDISWSSVSGATVYCIYRDSFKLICVSGTSWRDSSPGSSQRCYQITAKNECGESGKSGSRCTTAKQVPPIPGTPLASPNPVCVNTQYCLSWGSVSGATSYEISENNGSWVNIGNTTFKCYTKSSPGSYSYRVRACNSCGCSGASGSRNVTVQQCYSISGMAWCESGKGREPIEDKVVQLFKSGVLYETDTTNGQGGYFFEHLFSDNYCLKAAPYVTPNDDCIYELNTVFFDTLANPDVIGINIQFIGGPDGAPQDVEEIDAPKRPEHFVLSQNYPNPFNPETRIEFELPRRSFVTIDVYNIVGRRIRNLANEQLSAGLKAVTWDGRDDNGQPVSSGLYFYRMVTDEATETKKMMLLK